MKENDEIYIKVIGSRFQLNDNSISVLAEPLKQKFKKEEKSKRKIKIITKTD